MINKYLTFMFAAALLFQACKDEKLDPVLSLTKAQEITNPSSSDSYVLSLDMKDEILENITWTAAEFSLTNVPKTTYTVQMDLASNNFSAPATLATTNELNYEVTFGQINSRLLLMGAAPDVPVDVLLRIASNKDQKLDNIYSNVVTISVTPYGAAVNVKPLYLLGSGTAAGWDNQAALPMTYLDGGRYEIVTTLTAGADQFFKVISVLGQWAPQWGTDASALPENGPMVYRPTEADADPPAIPVPAITSQYKIIVDTALLTYEVFEFGDVYLLGDATLAGWDNTAALPMVKVSEGKYTITTPLTGGGKFWKIIDERGAWAPQWGTDANGTQLSGSLVLRPTESEPDPSSIPGPDVDGTYKIDIDIVNLTYTATLQ